MIVNPDVKLIKKTVFQSGIKQITVWSLVDTHFANDF